MVFFSLKSRFLRGVEWHVLLASNVTKVAVISGWNGLYGSMGAGGHVISLDLVMGALAGAVGGQECDAQPPSGMGISG